MRRLSLALVGTAVTALVLNASVFAHPGSGIAVDRSGVIYFVDTGAGLWKVDAKGALVAIPSPRFHWMALDQDDRLKNVRLPSGSSGEVTRVGSKPVLLLASDYPLAIGSDGNLYFPSRVSHEAVDIVRLSTSGARSIVTRIRVPHLNGLAAGPNGTLYFTEPAAIRRIDAQGRVATVAENVALTGCASIPATSSPELRGLAVAADGTVYVAASGCGRVINVTPVGEISTILQIESPWSPTAVTLSGRDVYVLEYLHTAVEDRRQWIPRIRRVSPDGKHAILATVSRNDPPQR